MFLGIKLSVRFIAKMRHTLRAHSARIRGKWFPLSWNMQLDWHNGERWRVPIFRFLNEHNFPFPLCYASTLYQPPAVPVRFNCSFYRFYLFCIRFDFYCGFYLLQLIVSHEMTWQAAAAAAHTIMSHTELQSLHLRMRNAFIYTNSPLIQLYHYG